MQFEGILAQSQLAAAEKTYLGNFDDSSRRLEEFCMTECYDCAYDVSTCLAEEGASEEAEQATTS